MNLKKVSLDIDKKIWEAVQLVKVSCNPQLPVRTIIMELIENYLVSYAKEKGTSAEMVNLIEKKLKAADFS